MKKEKEEELNLTTNSEKTTIKTVKQKSKTFKVISKVFSLISLIAILAVLIPTPTVFLSTKHISYTSDIFYDNKTLPDDIEYPTTGIVFGASITIYQRPTVILKDRLDIAADLYKNNVINRIILSGNDDTPYNEVTVMKKYIIETYPEIPPSVIELDGYGYRTYDTCIRSKELYNIDEAILITSGYHIPRAIYLCNKLGINSIGISSTLSNYENKEVFYLREIFAIDKSIIDLYILEPNYSKKVYEEPPIE